MTAFILILGSSGMAQITNPLEVLKNKGTDRATKFGIEASIMDTEAAGESKPVVPNDSTAIKSKIEAAKKREVHHIPVLMAAVIPTQPKQAITLLPGALLILREIFGKFHQWHRSRKQSADTEPLQPPFMQTSCSSYTPGVSFFHSLKENIQTSIMASQ